MNFKFSIQCGLILKSETLIHCLQRLGNVNKKNTHATNAKVSSKKQILKNNKRREKRKAHHL